MNSKLNLRKSVGVFVRGRNFYPRLNAWRTDLRNYGYLLKKLKRKADGFETFKRLFSGSLANKRYITVNSMWRNRAVYFHNCFAEVYSRVMRFFQDGSLFLQLMRTHVFAKMSKRKLMLTRVWHLGCDINTQRLAPYEEHLQGLDEHKKKIELLANDESQALLGAEITRDHLGEYVEESCGVLRESQDLYQESEKLKEEVKDVLANDELSREEKAEKMKNMWVKELELNELIVAKWQFLLELTTFFLDREFLNLFVLPISNFLDALERLKMEVYMVEERTKERAVLLLSSKFRRWRKLQVFERFPQRLRGRRRRMRLVDDNDPVGDSNNEDEFLKIQPLLRGYLFLANSDDEDWSGGINGHWKSFPGLSNVCVNS